MKTTIIVFKYNNNNGTTATKNLSHYKISNDVQ